MITDKSKCTGCGGCVNVCPVGCVEMVTDAEGFWYPQVDPGRCIHCGRCEAVCPVDGVQVTDEVKKAYAAFHRDAQIRAASSSGGVFTAIAQRVIENGGVVFGAALDERMRVVHGFADTPEGLAAFRGSKYVQSDIGRSYREAKKFLDGGRQVLFSGTPCQIGGLLGYLGKPYENLICQDIICHGVPSPLAWEKYLRDRQREAGEEPVCASFRSKRLGWTNFSMELSFKDGSKYTEVMGKDRFMKAFLGNYCLRPSCYRCAFKQEQRQADITLADFWGIDEVCPGMNDDGGTSLVLVHSHKGAQLLDTVKDGLEWTQVSWEKAVALNPAMKRSVDRPAKRDGFMEGLCRAGFDRAVKKYCEPSLMDKIKSLGYRALCKLRRMVG